LPKYKSLNMKWAVALLLLANFACKSKGPACIVNANDIIKGSPKKLITVYSSTHLISALYDEGWDSLKGGAYLFYPDEHLKSFTFYQSGNPVYTESYDDAGYLLNSKGSPMVDRIITELSEDTMNVQVYFYKSMKTYQQLSLQINNTTSRQFDLTKDTTYANMNSASFNISTSDLTHIHMYSQVKYMDDCNKVEHILNDSIFLLKDPHIGPAPAGSK